MSPVVYRIHPAIGIARVGNAVRPAEPDAKKEYYLAPETMAGFSVPGSDEVMGGLPIRAGTESELITSADIRDDQGALRRQAARFRIFQYDGDDLGTYPTPAGTKVTEVQIGSVVGGRTVTDIIWTVHLANKKANTYIEPPLGIDDYAGGRVPCVRNPQFENPAYNKASWCKDGHPTHDNDPKPSEPDRLKVLMIDAGPRVIEGTSDATVEFDAKTKPTYWTPASGITELSDYPVSFPGNHSDYITLDAPTGQIIETLGALETDAKGRLLVVPASGLANAWLQPDDSPYPLAEDVNNDGWFDDIGDGPVNAVLVFDDGSTHEVEGAAWVLASDPAYAPQTLNVVSLWDDTLDTWTRFLGLRPDVATGEYDTGKNEQHWSFNPEYKPSFADEIFPIFRAAELQQWNTNLNETARAQHDAVGRIKSDDPPNVTLVTKFIRDPSKAGDFSDTKRMPLSLGDGAHAFLAPSHLQYFFLTQWIKNLARPDSGVQLGPGEYLDKAVLANCLGGRFSPGIEMTFICRDPNLWNKDWKSPAGPFRMNARTLDYAQAKRDTPFLTEGYVPLRTTPVEPGDVTKFMSIPWHTDYNSCATHPTALPDPIDPDRTVQSGHYWSWPAQRPVAVYSSKDVIFTGSEAELGAQRFSVRGPGTSSNDQNEMGRYQVRVDFVKNWDKIGVIIQGTAIEGGKPYPTTWYLEVEGRLPDTGNQPAPWPAAGT